MVEYQAEFSWSIWLVIFFFLTSLIAKYFGQFRIFDKTFPVWLIPFSGFLICCRLLDFVSNTGFGFLVAFSAVSYFAAKIERKAFKHSLLLVAVLAFLSLGFHLIPGIHNLLLIDSGQLKQNASNYTLYLNFDKSTAGLIFFLLLVPHTHMPPRKKLLEAMVITLLTTILVLGVGLLLGLVDFSLEYRFDFRLILLFLMSQLLSTCLVEETFFRGFVQQKLYAVFEPKRAYFHFIPLLIASTLFGLVHFAGGVAYMLAATLAGVGYGLVYQLTRRVELSILAHTFLNLMHLTFFTYPFLLN